MLTIKFNINYFKNIFIKFIVIRYMYVYAVSINKKIKTIQPKQNAKSHNSMIHVC